MGMFRTPADRRQIALLPPTIDEYVPKEDTVRYVDMMVDELDLSAIESAYSTFGRPGYRPTVLVKILLYGKMRGIRSSRELARAAQENVRFMYIASNERPDFRTISDFRKRFHKELSGLLKQTIQIGIREGIIEMDHVAVDGTVIRAYAGKRSFRTRAHLERELERLEADLVGSFEKDIELDEEEDERFGDGDREGTLPNGLEDRETLRKRIRAALRHYKGIKTNKKGRMPKQVSLTDPECQFMKSNGGNHPSYNGQAAVDVRSRMVVGGYATTAVSDNGELPQVLEDIETNTGKNPGVLSADRGYSLKEGLHELKQRGIDGYIPQREERSGYFKQEDFIYDADTDTYRCPNNRTLYHKGYVESKRMKYNSYVCNECAGCPLVQQCILRGTQSRHLCISIYSSLYYEMKEKTQTPFGKLMAKIRGSTVEPTFGHIKANRGLRQFYFRGVKMIDSMWKLELATYNIEKLVKALFLDPSRRLAA